MGNVQHTQALIELYHKTDFSISKVA